MTKGGEQIDVERGFMPFVRELRVVKVGKPAGPTSDVEGYKVLAAVGGKGVRHYVRHPDGSLTDAKTGEPVSGD